MSDLEQTAIERLKLASDMSLRLFQKPLVITYWMSLPKAPEVEL